LPPADTLAICSSGRRLWTCFSVAPLSAVVVGVMKSPAEGEFSHRSP
jgi:hypothetical protein